MKINQLEKLLEQAIKKALKEKDSTVTTPTKTPVKSPTKTPSPTPSKNPWKTPPKPSINPRPKASKMIGAKFENAKIDEAIKYPEDIKNRMHKSYEKKLGKREDPFVKKGIFEKPEKDEDESLSEKLASERFSNLIRKVKQLSKNDNISDEEILMSIMTKLYEIINVDQKNKTRLEKLAVELVTEVYGIPDGAIQFDVALTGLKKPKLPKDSRSFKASGEASSQEAEDAVEDVVDYEPEKAKRRLLNSMIQGGATAANELHRMATQELNKIHPDLVDAYSLIMHANDLMYFIMGEDMVEIAGGDSQGGSARMNIVHVDFGKEPVEIYARAIIFPMLVHEITKGVLEYLTAAGIPNNPKIASKVIEDEDTIDSEAWDLRIGPQIWKKFLDALGVAKGSDILAPMIQEISKMPAKDIVPFVRGVISGQNDSLNKLKKIVNTLKAELDAEGKAEAEQAYQNAIGEDDYDKKEY